MAKISLNKLNLNKNTQVNNIQLGENVIEVIQYLPVSEKIDLLDIVIQESLIGYTCDPVLQDALFHTYLVMQYTNLGLTPTQKENILDTYDILEKNGVISEIISAIPTNEYVELVEGLATKTEKIEREMNSVIGVIREAIDRIPASLNAVQEQLASVNLDSETLKGVLAIAKDNGVL